MNYSDIANAQKNISLLRTSINNLNFLNNCINFLDRNKISIIEGLFSEKSFAKDKIEMIDNFVMDADKSNTYELINNIFIHYLYSEYPRHSNNSILASDSFDEIYNKFKIKKSDYIFNYIQQYVTCCNDAIICDYDKVFVSSNYISNKDYINFIKKMNFDSNFQKLLSSQSMIIDEKYDCTNNTYEIVFLFSSKLVKKINVNMNHLKGKMNYELKHIKTTLNVEKNINNSCLLYDDEYFFFDNKINYDELSNSKKKKILRIKEIYPFINIK